MRWILALAILNEIRGLIVVWLTLCALHIIH